MDNYFLPDMAVKFASLMKTSVTPRALKMSFKSIPCSTVNLENTQEEGIDNFFYGTGYNVQYVDDKSVFYSG